MSEFVLVAGAWLGGGAWDEVAAELRRAGHGARAVTLAGLAERRGEPADQVTHVRDVVEAVERDDLRDVVLVGHSYAGIPVGQAAERIGDRLARIVFVDAVVPADGESFVSRWWQGPEALTAAIEAADGFWPPPTAPELAGQDLDDEQIARFLAGATPHPGAALAGPAVLAGPLGRLPATYVLCLLDSPEPAPPVAELLTSERWRLVTMDTGHWPMLSRPRELAEVLTAAARA